ncbi:Protein of unknown function [Pedobacter steynii]|uniref:DUF4199 domain-containing protein n=1 Tax=Pedobacter steynii TaxID=430522 RepID=A0A1G9Z0W7_9SPHI|nr:DUF4199 domain-containing protein [Pedobacter steynii]NQX39886.1 DUF4199 domain-containing protein [Pedobacter steynii]SDN14266.1 Protein of unknown function [Pedobacter steynii]
METEQPLDNLKPEAAKNGLILGLITLVLGVISAYVLVKATSMWAIFLVPIGIGFLIPVILAVFLSLDLRKKIGGYWNLRQATSGIFIMFLASYIISTGGNFVFTKLIEPTMSSQIQSSVTNATASMMRGQGVDEATIEKKEAEMAEQFAKKESGTMIQTIQGHLIAVIIIFVVALLFGAIFKKSPPLFFTEDKEE